MGRFDVGIVGGGIVGLATARELLLRFPKKRLVLFEKEPELALHQSRWNSGVIHAGIYYRPDTKRAQFSVRGAKRMYQYARERNLPVNQCGKLIVAVREDELSRLDVLHKRGQENGVPDLAILDADELRQVEPHCVGLRALHSPFTGIINYRAVALEMAREVEGMGGAIRLGFKADAFEHAQGRVSVVSATGERVDVDKLITCAGLHSDIVAEKTGGDAEPSIAPFRGDFFYLKPEHRELVNGLIYPVPDPRLPWLGVHFTKLIDGNVKLGPNAVLATKREGYSLTDFDAREFARAATHRGLRKLVMNHWKAGALEVYRYLNPAAFVAAMRVYMPELTVDHVQRAPSGVRALAIREDGNGAFEDDFVFEPCGDSVLNVRNAPSPAATTSLVIAEAVADMAEGVLHL